MGQKRKKGRPQEEEEEEAETEGKKSEVSGYEQFRDQRIKENMKRLQKLGILDLSRKLKREPKKRPKKDPSEIKPSSDPPRRSSRNMRMRAHMDMARLLGEMEKVDLKSRDAKGVVADLELKLRDAKAVVADLEEKRAEFARQMEVASGNLTSEFDLNGYGGQGLLEIKPSCDPPRRSSRNMHMRAHMDMARLLGEMEKVELRRRDAKAAVADFELKMRDAKVVTADLEEQWAEFARQMEVASGIASENITFEFDLNGYAGQGLLE